MDLKNKDNNSNINYEEWFKKINAVSNIKEKVEEIKEKEEKIIDSREIGLLGLIFLIILIPRLLYLFVFSNPETPGWYTDTFHHWQIGYLSKEIGFSQGFLRLWDFKGMEYFWGLLHPLVLSFLFAITGSISIVIPRLLSVIGGSVSIFLLFLLIKKYFNFNAAFATVLFASFFPISLFSNTSGMQEELGMPLILTGLLLWPKKPILIGILFALASMVRAEYWLFSAGLILSTFFVSQKNIDKALAVFISYISLIAIYMKYLASWTGGNYIYPIYWNFLANAQGAWADNVSIIGEKLLAKQISQGIFAFGFIGAVLTLIKRPKYSLLFLFGFGNIIFIGFMIGLSQYVKGYFGRFWLDRLYNWPYLFTAILAIILLFYVIPKKIQIVDKLKLNWLILTASIILSQSLWNPINFWMKVQGIEDINKGEKKIAQEIASVYNGGVILLPEDRPGITYFLANDFKIEAKNLEGQMFDAFFYFENKEQPFDNWEKDRKIVFNWLKKDNIRLIVLTAKKDTYLSLVEREPSYFKKLPLKNVTLYEVELDNFKD